MKFKTLAISTIGCIAIVILSNTLTSCSGSEKDGATTRDAKALKIYGDEVKIHEASKGFDYIYANHGNDEKLSTIAADYLGRSTELLNLKQKSKELKSDYIEYVLVVDELPTDLKGLNTIFTKEDRNEHKGKRKNVIVDIAKRDDLGMRSQHTLLVDFPMLANSELPTVSYGFDKKAGNKKNKLHIKKIKSADFQFDGVEYKYFVGAKKPFRSESIEVKYDTELKKYRFKTDSASGDIDLDRITDLYNGSDSPLTDDMKYSAIVNNLKIAQNKYINSGGNYKVPGLLRFLSDMELNSDFPLRGMYMGEALMKHSGSSLSDGKSYVKLVMDDMQIGLLIDIDGYISQYQQVIVDKAKGIVEKTVLIRR